MTLDPKTMPRLQPADDTDNSKRSLDLQEGMPDSQSVAPDLAFLKQYGATVVKLVQEHRHALEEFAPTFWKEQQRLEKLLARKSPTEYAVIGTSCVGLLSLGSIAVALGITGGAPEAAGVVIGVGGAVASAALRWTFIEGGHNSKLIKARQEQTEKNWHKLHQEPTEDPSRLRARNLLQKGVYKHPSNPDLYYFGQDLAMNTWVWGQTNGTIEKPSWLHPLKDAPSDFRFSSVLDLFGVQSESELQSLFTRPFKVLLEYVFGEKGTNLIANPQEPITLSFGELGAVLLLKQWCDPQHIQCSEYTSNASLQGYLRDQKDAENLNKQRQHEQKSQAAISIGSPDSDDLTSAQQALSQSLNQSIGLLQEQQLPTRVNPPLYRQRNLRVQRNRF